jgi:hypothetical protein
MIDIHQEEQVKRKWTVRRSLVQREDAQRRWDIAYQRLLQWTHEVATVPDESTVPITTQEVNDESRHLYTRIDLATTTKPNH